MFYSGFSVDSISDKDALQKRCREIDKQMKNLAEEQEMIQLKIQGNYGRKQQCVNNKNNTNTQSSNINKDIIKSNFEEEQKSSESKILDNNQDSTQKENFNFLNKASLFSRETFVNFEQLKSFFEEYWNPEYFEDTFIPSSDKCTEREKIADMKLDMFRNKQYIDAYDEKIQQAVIKQEDFDLPPDQFKDAAENLFETLIIRSKVLDLFEQCGKQAGFLYNNREGSSLQRSCHKSIDLLDDLQLLIDNYSRFEWNFEKIRAVIELWQAGVASRYQNTEFCENYYYYNDLYGKFMNILNKENLELTEEQRGILLPILKLGRHFCTDQDYVQDQYSD